MAAHPIGITMHILNTHSIACNKDFFCAISSFKIMILVYEKGGNKM
jgi:hypothetical protein